VPLQTISVLVRNSGLFRDDILAKQVEYHEQQAARAAEGDDGDAAVAEAAAAEDEYDDDDDLDSDDEELAAQRKAAAAAALRASQADKKKKLKSSMSFKLLRDVVDPMRQVLSAAKQLYLPKIGGVPQAVRATPAPPATGSCFCR
jgi:hypothetical protein